MDWRYSVGSNPSSELGMFVEDSGWVFISLGTNSSMFENCSSFGDVREVRSSVLGLKVMFGEVRSSVLMFGEHYEHLGS